MMVASTMGAAAFQKGLGGMHAMSHPCGAVLGTHHGLTNAVVMPYVLVYNRPAIAERMAALARYLDLADASFDAVLDWILALRQELGIPATLGEIGVTEAHVAQLASMAAVDPSVGGNPLPLTVDALAGLFNDAISGKLER
jgi:alcohol dehydrogenase class IV